MNLETTTVEKITLTKVKALDPITIILDDRNQGVGAITITCFGKAWTALWGGMGEKTVADFFLSCHDDYLADRLSSVSASEIDYETISNKIGQCVDVTTAYLYADELAAAYGPDWHMDLPTCPNPDYQYLKRIIRAVQCGLQERKASQATVDRALRPESDSGSER